MRIDGVSALVAGGASGLGAATVRALHEAGARVVICDLNPEKGEALAGELGERAGFVEANVMEEDRSARRSRRPPKRMADCGYRSAAPGSAGLSGRRASRARTTWRSSTT